MDHELARLYKFVLFHGPFTKIRWNTTKHKDAFIITGTHSVSGAFYQFRIKLCK